MKKKQKFNYLNVKSRARRELRVPFLLVLFFFFSPALVILLFFPMHLEGGCILLTNLGIVVFLFLLYFSRDPERIITGTQKDILCPADGIIVGVESVENVPGIKGRYNCISIYLNAFNIHVQRMPVAGKIAKITRLTGGFLPAFNKNAGMKNRQNVYHVEGDIQVVVRQIAGVLVHRPVSWVKPGDFLKAGERFGMITFGSRVELYVPINCRIIAKEGDKVKGGIDILAKIVKKNR